jgi:hypothetical protein
VTKPGSTTTDPLQVEAQSNSQGNGKTYSPTTASTDNTTTNPQVWQPGRPGVADDPQGPLPSTAGVKPGEPLSDGGYHYVVTEDGSLRALKNEEMWDLEGSAGHTSLAEGKPVIMAGTFDVEDGQIVRFDNYSGHYQPSEQFGFTPLEDVARTEFSGYGLEPLEGAWDPWEDW